MKKIALITGASRGIGAATARLAASAGYDVCVNFASDNAAANSIVENCKAKGVRAFACKADVAKANEVEALFQRCDAELGKVTLLVNNAGIVGKAAKLTELKDEVIHATFAINVFGTMYCSREAIRRM